MTDNTTTADGDLDHETNSSHGYPTGYDHVSAINQPLTALAQRGHSRFRVFDDWVTLMLTALAGDDDAYLDVADAYDREGLNKFVAAFAELMATTERYQVDVLGDAYEAFGMQADNFGQHFTPHSASEGMAEMQMVTRDEDATEEDGPRIADPTCGSGRLLIAAARRAPNGRFHGVDKDPLCAKMATVNLALFGLSGVIVQGDSLSLDCHRAWAVREGRIIELDPAEEDVKDWLGAFSDA